MGEIYRLDFLNGKSYIGLSTRTAVKRFYQHKCAARDMCKGAIYSAWRKYGPPKLAVLAIVEQEELAATEVRAIALFNTIAPHGYNMSFGGEMSPLMNPAVYSKFMAQVSSPEYRAKQSENATRVQSSPEYRSKMSESVRAAQSRPEVRAKHLAAMNLPERRAASSRNKKALWKQAEYRAKVRERWADPEFKSKYVSPMKSATSKANAKATWATPEAKAKKSNASREAWKSNPRRREQHAARLADPEFQAKCSASRRAYMQTDEYRKKMSAIMKKVRAR